MEAKRSEAEVPKAKSCRKDRKKSHKGPKATPGKIQNPNPIDLQKYSMTMVSRPSPGGSYFSTIHGSSPSAAGGGASASSLSAATSAAAAAVPPPPFSEESQKVIDDDTNTAPSSDVHNSSSALNSTPYLQSRLVQLRHQSQDLSTELTKKLATSRSGQSLLHIGPSLSTLPPDLTSLLEALSPLLSQVEQYETENRGELDKLVHMGREVQCAVKKREFSEQCAEIYSDLMGAEEVLRWKNKQKKKKKKKQQSENMGGGGKGGKKNDEGKNDDMDEDEDDWSEDETEEGKKFIWYVFKFLYVKLWSWSNIVSTLTPTNQSF